MTHRISPARLQWQGDQPVSATFGDIYHAPDGAAEVTRVFLAPSDFTARLARASRPSNRFRIGELGFGSGLNLAVAATAAIDAGCPLDFISFEAAPIDPADFARLAARRQPTHPIYAELARQYPPLVRGWHQRHLAGGRIRLTLFWGDANIGMAELASTLQRPVDAWFLDGFAPDRNPELWNDALFTHMARLSATGSTVATFTAAGRVRRSLQAAGFAMRRVDQRPHKRESLAGVFSGAGAPRSTPPATATVFGAGLAGASAARHLAEAGLAVVVHDPAPPSARRPDDPAAETTGAELRAGSAMPTTVLHGRLLADTGVAGALRCHAFHYAAAWASRFPGFTPTGVLQLPAADASEGASGVTSDGPGRLAAIAAAWGDTGPWLEAIDQTEARLRTGWAVPSGGLWFPAAGVVETPALCAALLDHPAIELRTAPAPLPAVAGDPDAPVILACGAAIREAPAARYLELAPVPGQLDYVKLVEPPGVPVVGRGYLAPAGPLTAAGATYEYRPWASDMATRHNLAQLGDMSATWHFRARGMRVTSSDRVAVGGPLFDIEERSLAPLYVSTGHGSMGNVSSHFVAALLCAMITGDVLPMQPDLVAALSPRRFRERQRRRGYRQGAAD